MDLASCKQALESTPSVRRPELSSAAATVLDQYFMLKKIDIRDLRVGMHVHELCGAWIDSPMWRKSFLLKEEQSLEKITQSGIREAWIDTSRGLDVPTEKVGGTPSHQRDIPAAVSIASSAARRSAGLGEEMQRAARIVDNSRQAVASMFSEARMGRVVDSANALPVVEEIADSVLRHPGALISIARLKTADDYTYMHSVAVCALMVALSRQLGLKDKEMREAGLAGLLHDIGKMAVPPSILNKPGKLSDSEFMSVREHPKAGHDMLRNAKGISDIALDVCLHHHEKMDGTGYPGRLAGSQISLFAKMGAVCDVYDAITSNRPYKAGWCPAESLRKMAEWSKGHFDPVVFQAFVRSIGIYPTGSLVRLESGRLGVVVEQQAGKSLLLPKVRVFFSSKSMAYIAPELVDLSHPAARDKIVSSENGSAWGFKNIDRYWNEEPGSAE